MVCFSHWYSLNELKFTFSHLADAFIQSDLQIYMKQYNKVYSKKQQYLPTVHLFLLKHFNIKKNATETSMDSSE